MHLISSVSKFKIQSLIIHLKLKIENLKLIYYRSETPPMYFARAVLIQALFMQSRAIAFMQIKAILRIALMIIS